MVGLGHRRRQRGAARRQKIDARPEDVAQPPAGHGRIGIGGIGEDLFVKARHRVHVRRLDLGQVDDQCLGRLRQAQRQARQHTAVMVHRASVNVAIGQPAQQHVGRPVGRSVDDRLSIAQQVAVRQHHALGLAGGARGVHEGGQRLPVQLRLAPGQFAGQRPQSTPAARQERSPGADAGRQIAAQRVKSDDAAQAGQVVAHLAELVELAAGRDKQPAGAGVGQLIANLLRGQGGVGRDIDGGGAEHAHVGDQPFQAVLGEQADAVARLDAGVGQGGGTGQGIGPVLRPGQVVIQAVTLVAQGGGRPEALGLEAVQLGEVPVWHGSFPCFPRQEDDGR